MIVLVSNARLCAVCREVKCGGVLLPDDTTFVCASDVVTALRWMVVDAEACRGGGSGAFAPSRRMEAGS